ncbi:DUF5104 domain-containing protein [Candidatus Weimeria sp. HCP3S3_B5]|uniref:DUF5104 domain-containing protein n=1 Tax=Candidatus Weimeria sp. HCP3S3_B5 TaxID=3438871 RepID=UPI003F8AA1B0
MTKTILYGYIGMSSGNNKRKIKAIGAIIMFSFLAIMMSSCGASKYYNMAKDKINEYRKKRHENDIQGIVMNAIMENDVEVIYQKLCPQLKERPGIRKQISEFIGSFDSDVVKWHRSSKDVISRSVEDGETIAEYDGWTLDNVETKKGTKYMLVICVYSVNKSNPDMEGIFALGLHTEAGSSSEQKTLYSIIGSD